MNNIFYGELSNDKRHNGCSFALQIFLCKRDMEAIEITIYDWENLAADCCG